MGLAIGLWAALALSAPAATRPINLNLPPPRPPALAALPPNFLAPTAVPPSRPARLAPWLFPDPSMATFRHGGGGRGPGRFFGGGHGHGGGCHGGGHH